jgi:threonine/homoserine/homoserine lactone efflux protein
VPTTAELIAFSLTSMILIAIPGPSVLFVIGRSLSLGRHAGLATVISNSVGEYVLVIAVAVGIGPLVEDSIVAFTIIKFVGASYLIYLGIQALRHRRSVASALNAGQAHTSTRRILRDGFVVGVTNPKSMIYFAALLPQFVNRSAGRVPLQLLLLGCIFIAIALVSDTVWALAAGAARSWFARSPRRLELIGGVSGVAMIGIGARLAMTGRHD